VLLTCTMDRCFTAGLAYFLGVRRLGAAAIRNGLNTMGSHAKVIGDVAPTVVVGVPSFLRHLGEFLRNRACSVESVAKLICIGEPVRTPALELSAIGEQLRELWQASIYSTYASSEIVTSFCECEAERGGHLHADLGILEIVDEAGDPLPAGETGEVTVTPMRVTAMPLVRFRTGDISFMMDEPCSCGRSTPRLGPILGRKAQMLKVRGSTLFPQTVFSILDAAPEVSDYYVIATGEDLSDHVEVVAALKDPDASVDDVAAKVRAGSRVAIPVSKADLDEVRAKVFSAGSRKPVRFFDCRNRAIPEQHDRAKK